MDAASHRRCFACGKPWTVGDRFCPRCGTRLGRTRRAAVLPDMQESWTTLALAFPDDPVPKVEPPTGDPPAPILADAYLDRVLGIDLDAEVAAGQRPDDSMDPTDAIVHAFDRLAAAVTRLPDRSRSVISQRFGLASDGQLRTLLEVADASGVTRERIRQIERKALGQLAYERGSFDAAYDRVEDLRQQLGLSWRDESLATALAALYPHTPWTTLGHLRLLAAILPGRTPPDRGIKGIEAAAISVIARAGALPSAEIERQILSLLNPTDLARFPALSIARRLDLLGPVVRGDDGRYNLPDGAVGATAERRVRRLNAMIRVLERLGPSHFTTIAYESSAHLPPEHRLSERDVHAWLGRYSDVFVWVGKGRFGLASQDVGIRVDDSVPNDGLPDAYRSRRRKGIGDEIARLLLERGPTPIDAITEHILSRFQVASASVLAAVQQDAARRFTTTGDRLVALRVPDDGRER